MTNLSPILRVLPRALASGLERLDARDLEALEELRLRAGYAPTVLISGRERPVTGAAGPVDSALLQSVVSLATGFSAYAAQESLKQGYLTLPGGHRLGVCGMAVVEAGQVKTLKELSSLNLRVARALPGLAEPILQAQRAQRHSLLIVGPPGSGKTTLLRDAVRLLSDQLGCRMAVADERCELAAVYQGAPQLSLGCRTDILSGCPKAQAAALLLRAMNPEYLVMDEITAPADLEALRQAAYCGTRLLATAHADGLAEMKKRPLYRDLLKLGVFRRAAVLRAEDKSYTLEEIV